MSDFWYHWWTEAAFQPVDRRRNHGSEDKGSDEGAELAGVCRSHVPALPDAEHGGADRDYD